MAAAANCHWVEVFSAAGHPDYFLMGAKIASSQKRFIGHPGHRKFRNWWTLGRNSTVRCCCPSAEYNEPGVMPNRYPITRHHWLTPLSSMSMHCSMHWVYTRNENENDIYLDCRRLPLMALVTPRLALTVTPVLASVSRSSTAACFCSESLHCVEWPFISCVQLLFLFALT
jgi:hypothetical protein